MRIGVDLDGVVANFTKGWTTQYEAEFGKKILENITLNTLPHKFETIKSQFSSNLTNFDLLCIKGENQCIYFII